MSAYHENHITQTHGVTREQFEQAWHDPHRHDETQPNGLLRSLGHTEDDRLLEMLWRWDRLDPSRVFPITAYFV